MSLTEEPVRVAFGDLGRDQKVWVVLLEVGLFLWLGTTFVVIGMAAVMGTDSTGDTGAATVGILLVPALHAIGLMLGIYLGMRRSSFVRRVLSLVAIGVVVPLASFFSAYVVINS